jgi:succinate dehydrogenase / fumarate reductase, cytochrome b subunit
MPGFNVHEAFTKAVGLVSNQATTVDPASARSRKRRPPRTLYRGDPGMWSWVLHRISGATIFFFLFVHVLDAAMLRVSPQTYDAVVGDYKTPLVGLMEYGLIAAVLFHGLNGIRIILIDFWSQGPRHQRLMFLIVGIVFLLLMVPAGVVTGIHIWEHLR